MNHWSKGAVVLACHPGTPAKCVRHIDAVVAQSGGGIAITYSLQGELKGLHIAAPGLPRRAEGLWQHTCFEAFICAEGTPAYREFNFAPSGEWAAYAFRDYREGAPLGSDFDPKIAVRSTAGRFELAAFVPADCLPAGAPEKTLRLGLSAVIEEEGGGLSYWALKHPLDRPDFHHRDSFVLEIARLNLDGRGDPAYTAKP